MYRCAVITKQNNALSLNGTKEEIDIWLLNIIDVQGVKYYKIIDKDTKEVIETEKGKK